MYYSAPACLIIDTIHINDKLPPKCTYMNDNFNWADQCYSALQGM